MAIFDLKLKDKKVVCDDVAILDFTREGGGAVPYKPGQYINIFFGNDKNGGHSGRSYSMIPSKEGVRIAVRRKGEFSSSLHGLAIGSTVVADGPYGSLCPKKEVSRFVCIAAGIGIAPFISWSDDIASRKDSGEDVSALFMVSNSHKRRAPFVYEPEPALSKNAAIHLELFFTQEGVAGTHQKRIDQSDLEKALRKFPEADFAICGSITFTRDMWRALRKLGVPDERILTEAFY